MPRSDDIADGELVRRVRRGDDAAFEALYHRYHRRITAYIHGMVHDHARSEDVAQDVFVSALRRMRDTDRPIAFKPWIYEIAKNACIDQFRRSKRAEEVSYDAEEGMGAADYGRLVSSEAMPESQLESKQNLDHLRGAFGGLSETHHEILVMRELEGLSYREIGERLGMSRPSVESTLFRARRRLTEEYEELVSGARCQRIQGIIAGATGTAPGARDQRRLARHVSHCQPCRRQARLAGLEIPATAGRPVRERIAAFLPLPLFLRKRWSGEGGDAVAGPGVAQWAHLGATMDPSWLKAAATAATVAFAGASAGLAGNGADAGARSLGLAPVVPALGGSGTGADADRRTAGRPRVGSAFFVTTAPVAERVTAAAPQAGQGREAADGPSRAASTTAGAAAPALDQGAVGETLAAAPAPSVPGPAAVLPGSPGVASSPPVAPPSPPVQAPQAPAPGEAVSAPAAPAAVEVPAAPAAVLGEPAQPAVPSVPAG